VARDARKNRALFTKRLFCKQWVLAKSRENNKLDVPVKVRDRLHPSNSIFLVPSAKLQILRSFFAEQRTRGKNANQFLMCLFLHVLHGIKKETVLQRVTSAFRWKKTAQLCNS
jgi:hypothetical protein